MMLSPRPVPSTWGIKASCARKNRWKSRARASTGTPTPLSATSTTTSQPPSSRVTARPRTSTHRSSEFGSEYLIALAIRFVRQSSTAAALTSKLWLIKQDAGGEWQAKEVATIGDPAKIPLPVDISITRDGKGLWVNTFMDGTTRYFDLSKPDAPKQTYAKVTGKQVNMISQSWDGKRVYITSSLLANWDKGGADNEQFIRGFTWDGKELRKAFEVDFNAEKLGRAHHMKLGTAKLKKA